MGWLTANHPELTTEYERLYRDRSYLPRHPRSRVRPNPGRTEPVSQPALPFG
jgi:hypothetical protein